MPSKPHQISLLQTHIQPTSIEREAKNTNMCQLTCFQSEILLQNVIVKLISTNYFYTGFPWGLTFWENLGICPGKVCEFGLQVGKCFYRLENVKMPRMYRFDHNVNMAEGSW